MAVSGKGMQLSLLCHHKVSQGSSPNPNQWRTAHSTVALAPAVHASTWDPTLLCPHFRLCGTTTTAPPAVSPLPWEQATTNAPAPPPPPRTLHCISHPPFNHLHPSPTSPSPLFALAPPSRMNRCVPSPFPHLMPPPPPLPWSSTPPDSVECNGALHPK